MPRRAEEVSAAALERPVAQLGTQIGMTPAGRAEEALPAGAPGLMFLHEPALLAAPQEPAVQVQMSDEAQQTD